MESYLSGRLDKSNEAQEDSNEHNGKFIHGKRRAAQLGDVQKKSATATEEFDWHPKQRQLKDNIDRRVEQALCARHDEDPDKAEKARDRAMEHGQAVVGLGGPGTGKTTVAAESIKRAQELGARILIAVPTGQMSSRMRQLFPDLEVDTCHGAFLFHKPEMEAAPLMSQYDLVYPFTGVSWPCAVPCKSSARNGGLSRILLIYINSSAVRIDSFLEEYTSRFKRKCYSANGHACHGPSTEFSSPK